MILVSLAVVTAKLLDARPLASANDRSRWCTVWSLVERNSWQIDEIRQQPGWDTIDIVRVDGHFYSTKPPLLPLAVAQVYRGVKALTRWNLLDQTDQTVRLILFLVNVLPWAAALGVLANLVNQHCEERFSQRLIMATACFGTMLTPYLTVFNNHTVAATFLIFALAPALRILCENRENWQDFLWCGLASGVLVTQELPAASFAACLLLMLGRQSLKQTLTLFLPGLLVPIAAAEWVNYSVTGGLLPFYAGYGTEIYNFVHEGVPSYWSQPNGIDRPRDSLPEYLLHCTIGHHGIFSLSPIFLLSLAAWWQKDAWRKSRLLAIRWLPPLLTVVVLGFYLTRTANYNYSGLTVALRWMLWLVPLWLVSLIPAFNEWGRSTEFRSWALGLLAVSVFSAWYPANSPWTQNWIFRLLEQSRWIDYSESPLALRRKHSSWIGNLPQGETQPDYWITFASMTADGRREEIKLTDAGPRNEHRLVKVRWSSDGAALAETTYVLSPDQFQDGGSVDQFLVEREGGGPLTDGDRQFFSGLPRPATYRSGENIFKLSYLRTTARTDAFECHPAFAFLTQPDHAGIDRQYVRDVWYCAEVPFGVAQWEERVIDSASRQQLSRRRWQVSAVGKTFGRDQADLKP